MTSYLECLEVLIGSVRVCIGGGIYFYPDLFLRFGIYKSVIWTAMAAIASIFGVYIY